MLVNLTDLSKSDLNLLVGKICRVYINLEYQTIDAIIIVSSVYNTLPYPYHDPTQDYIMIDAERIHIFFKTIMSSNSPNIDSIYIIYDPISELTKQINITKSKNIDIITVYITNIEDYTIQTID